MIDDSGLRPEYSAAWGEHCPTPKVRRPMAELVAERYGAGIAHCPWRQRQGDITTTVATVATSTKKVA